MDWSGKSGDASEAEGVDTLVNQQRMASENPGLAQATAGLMGGLDFMSLGGMHNPVLRSTYPWTYRAGQAAIPVGLTLAARQFPAPTVPNILAAVGNDPAVQRLYYDHIAPLVAPLLAGPTVAEDPNVQMVKNPLARSE